MSRRKDRKTTRNQNLALNRHLHVVDIENLVGPSFLTREQVRAARRLVDRYVSINDGDITITGASSIQGLLALPAWGPSQPRYHPGKDGADLALLWALDESVTLRFSSVTLYSGDCIFADRLAEIAAHGLQTTVVARRGCLSRRLELAAQHVILLPPLDNPPTPLAA